MANKKFISNVENIKLNLGDFLTMRIKHFPEMNHYKQVVCNASQKPQRRWQLTM